MLRLSARHLRSEELAREVVQQTFFQLHAARHDVRADAKLRPWVFTIAMNLVREHFRKKKRRKETGLEEARAPAGDLRERSPLEQEERARLLRAAMAQLPESQPHPRGVARRGARQRGRAAARPRPLRAAVESRIAVAERSPAFWPKSRSSGTRRALAGAAAALIVGLGGVLLLRGDFASYMPMPMAIALGSLASVAIHQALRPLHRPPMSRGARAAVVVLTLGATFGVAIFSPSEVADDVGARGLLEHVSPCLFCGLLVGLPLYLALRLLDRGGARTALLAACAAGLIGNLVLTLECPIDDPTHLVLGHALVAVVYLAGLGVVHGIALALGR